MKVVWVLLEIDQVQSDSDVLCYIDTYLYFIQTSYFCMYSYLF